MLQSTLIYSVTVMPSLLSLFRRNDKPDHPGVEEILADEAGAWHPDNVKSRILDLEERLHLQLLWQKFIRAWSILGNVALVVLAFYIARLQVAAWSSRYAVYLHGFALLSILTSPLLLYWQYKRTRATRLKIKKLNLVRRRLLADQAESGTTEAGSPLANQKRYRDDVLDLIAQFQEDANRNRRIHNRFQTVVISGSVFSAAIATAGVSYSQARWAAVVTTAAVGLAAGFTGYFKYHERSFSSQQAADSIEREYEAVELRVGKYAKKDEEDAYAIFADAVERLRDEQSKRQQQLDQPVEVKRDE